MTKLRSKIQAGSNALMCLAGLALMIASAASVSAQGGPGGRGRPSLEPEKQAAAWKVQASTVARSLRLDETETNQLTEDYEAARKGHGEAMAKLREDLGEGGGFGNMQMYLQLSDKSRGEFGAVLGEYIEEEQVATALESLGAFSSEWDRMADTLTGFDLAQTDLASALDSVMAYVVATTKARKEAIASFDFQVIRTLRQEAKEELDGKLASILSEEQMEDWTESTTRRRRGGPGGGGSGGPGGGGPGGGGGSGGGGSGPGGGPNSGTRPEPG